jgi:rhamnulose-1-phosphate aldolase/alcohol dehydrogenase
MLRLSALQSVKPFTVRVNRSFRLISVFHAHHQRTTVVCEGSLSRVFSTAGAFAVASSTTAGAASASHKRDYPTWNPTSAVKDELDSLVYRSNLLGSDQRVTNTGGGNTSAKITEIDPLTGEKVEVLWVKGSGGDLRTSSRSNFASLYMEKLQYLKKIYNSSDSKGPKTPIEDDMVGLYPQTTFNLNPRASSIDTPLHAFVPFKHVDHTHPNSVISVAAAINGPELTTRIFGEDVEWMDWQRPGFDLGLKLEEMCLRNPKLKGVVMGQHGLISWTNDSKSCYDLSLELIKKAENFIDSRDKRELTFGGQKYVSLGETDRKRILSNVLPWLRGQVAGSGKRSVGTYQDDETVLRFINSEDAPRLAELGTSCPDHFLRTKIKPLYVPWNPQAQSEEELKQLLVEGLRKYREDYAAYYERCKRPTSPAMRDPNPTVILIPGVGMIAFGKDKSESRVTAEFYNCAIEVMRGAEAIGGYRSLPEQEAFDIEYWLLEEAKLKRMPAEKELARQVVVVFGAGSGIGKVTAHRVAEEGAHVVCVDMNEEAAKQTAKEICSRFGVGIGVAGSGVSSCGPALGFKSDITKRDSVKQIFEQVTLAYGGCDSVIVTAGLFVPPDASGTISDDKWALTFAVNVTGSYIIASEASKLWRLQNLKGNLVLTTSANAVVAKKGSVAYDTSKAAANHLVRELAIELAPLIRVNAIAPATVVKGSSMFPRERVISSLQKYAISFSPEESTEELTGKLASFYADRTLTKDAITPEDQAEAAYLLVTKRLSKTTGQVITVDGGLIEGFMR